MNNILLNKTERPELKEKSSMAFPLYNEMEVGTALHEMIFDKEGHPADYRFIEVNVAFEKYTGLKRENILGKTALELFTSVKKSRILKYGEVAFFGDPIEFVDYMPSMGKYFQVKATCPKKGLQTDPWIGTF